MKRILSCIIILFTAAAQIPAQDYYSSNRFSLRIMPVYENWNVMNNAVFSEFTNSVSMGYYATRDSRISLSTKYASVGGDLNKLNGFSDSQISFMQSLTKYNLILSLGINLPSGKTKLTDNQYQTLKIISQGLFGLRTPDFGQGTNFILGATWVHQVSDNFVIGFGLSYQIKSSYQPLQAYSWKYKPANEVSVTGGFDLKLQGTQTLTGDATGIFYGNDKMNGNDVFSSGSRTLLDVMYKKYFGYNKFSALLFYSIVSEKYYDQNVFSDINILNNLTPTEIQLLYSQVDNVKLNPNRLYLRAAFDQRFSQSFSMGYGLFASVFEKTVSFFSGYTLYGLMLTPDLTISPSVAVPFLLKFSRGSAANKPDIQSFTVGAGISLSL